jgi:hypothetical protein
MEESLLPGTVAKVNEYTLRILNGEDPNSVLDGADAFRPLVENAVAQYKEKKKSELELEETEGETIPETTFEPTVSTDEITEREREDEIKIKELQNELGVPVQESVILSPEEIERRKKLSGWSASYELAAIAQQEGIDLSALSREDYAQYAIDKYLAIDDAQLRVQPWQRNEVSVEAIVLKGREQRAGIDTAKEKEFATFSYSMMELAKREQKDRFLKENVRILSGTKDSNSWLFFSINNGTNQQETDTYKSYFSLKDLNNFSPAQFVSFMEELQKRGYNGGVKIFQDLTEQATRLNDQVVMHGFSEQDAKMAVEVAKEFFGQNIAETSVGKDEIVDGKSQSYSQLLAEKIKEEVRNKK